MKFLIITTKVPYPPYRGDKLKIYNISKILLKSHQVKIITFYRNESELTDLENLRKSGFDIEAVYLPYKKSVLNLWRSFFSFRPFQVSAFYSSYMNKRIKELAYASDYDVIYFHLFVTIQYFQAIKNVNALKVVDFTDSVSLYLSRFIRFLKNPLKKVVFHNELKRVKRYEANVKSFDTLFVCSPVDQKYLSDRKIHENIQLLQNGVDLSTFKYDKDILPQKGRIIFSGNMTYFPNTDAAKFFVKEIFPLIQQKENGTKFFIVGQDPPQEIVSLGSENIVITGFVPEIQKEYQLSDVNVAPIRFGSGTLNKIIEALALGVPTVASGLAVGGLPEGLKKYVYVAETPSEFADKVLELLKNRNVSKNFMEEARKVIADTLSWEKIVTEFAEYLKNRIRKNKP